MTLDLIINAPWMRPFQIYRRTGQRVLDGGLFAASLILAWAIRFESWPVDAKASQLLVWTVIAVAARISVNSAWGVYRFVWRYVSVSDAVVIAQSLGLVTAGLIAVRALWPGAAVTGSWEPLPLSVIALEFLLSLTGSLGARILRRIVYESQRRKAADCSRPPVRMVLYGAGQAGMLLLRDLHARRDVEVVGFVDDDPVKAGKVICGARVLGTGQDLSRLHRELGADEVVISIANAGKILLKKIVTECHKLGIPARVIPSLRDILDGRVSIGRLQEINLEELLGREAVHVDDLDDEAAKCYRGKRILVTGGGGSIGSELVRQLARLEPAAVAILDKDENSVYELQQELSQGGLGHLVEPLIADIRNSKRLRNLFMEFRPQAVLHAAAHKHVPLMEKHPCEAILNNVIGTKNVLEASRLAAVDRFVFISTDKAVNPSSIMGATKRIGELLVQAYASTGSRRAACVRFGNVLGSRGSIIPLFQQQIAHGGPVTVTHPDVERFFMTIPEAVQLILCAGTGANCGELFVLDMGIPRRILDLAREMVLLSGLQRGRQIEIAITGLRPGEKLSEKLTTSGENLQPTRYERLSMVIPAAIDPILLQSQVAVLERAATNNNHQAIYEHLANMGIGYRAPDEISALPPILKLPPSAIPVERSPVRVDEMVVRARQLALDSEAAS